MTAAYPHPLQAIRQVQVQAIGAAISRRNWHDCEAAYNQLRDRIDAALAAGGSVAEEWDAYMQAAVSSAPEPLRQLGEYLAGVLDEDQWRAADRYLNAAALNARAPHADGNHPNGKETT